MVVCVKITSEPSNVDEELKYRKARRQRRSAALSTPPAVHVHVGSDGPASNGSISSRGTDADKTVEKNIGQRQTVAAAGTNITLGLKFAILGYHFQI